MPQDPITRRETLVAASTLAATVAFGTAAAPVGANAQAAASTVDTRIGKIDLLMGLPANAEVERRIYDEMDFQRACQGYVWALPIVSMNEWKRAHETVLGAKPGELVLYDSYKDKLGILTANFTTPYIVTFHNLEKEPIVVEQPAGALAGMVMDFWQRPIVDLGQAGPDQGKGGKYLLIGPGQDPPQADGFYVVRSSTNNVFIGIRVLEPGEDKIKAAAERFRIYPYAGDGPPQRAARRPDGKDWSQVQPRGMKYWESLAEMLEQEPVHERDRMITAMLAPLGLEKGRRFAPNEQQTKLLTENEHLLCQAVR